MSKTFIVGLPRTGTTSLCVACINLGFPTAHTAYTVDTLTKAHVIADTPVFIDYQLLYSKFPNSKFIYLDRELELWSPSISNLLMRMSDNLFSKKGGFNDTIKRCFLTAFAGVNENNLDNFDYLNMCYKKHRDQAVQFFEHTKVQHLFLNISAPDSILKLGYFMGVGSLGDEMPKLNTNGKVTAWNDFKHPLKISSTRFGKVDKDRDLLAFMQSV